VHATKAHEGVEVWLYSFLILALDGVGGQLHDTAALLPVKQSPVPNEYETVWAPQSLWKFEEEKNPLPPRQTRGSININNELSWKLKTDN
jgi:hypothetical protein